jgi:hypothetical protein
VPCAAQRLCARQIQKRLVDRQRLDQRRQRVHVFADLATDVDIFCHVRLDDHSVRAQLIGLEHGHSRANAGLARDIAAGGDNAAHAAADNHRPVAQVGVVALFDRGEECVAIDVGNREQEQFLMAAQARRAAGGAAVGRGCACVMGQAIAAKPILGQSLACRIEPVPDAHELLGAHPDIGANGEQNRLV